MDIQGRTFLVTGGAQGMGRCFVEELSKLGANAIFCDINEAGIAEVEQALCGLCWYCPRNGC